MEPKKEVLRKVVLEIVVEESDADWIAGQLGESPMAAQGIATTVLEIRNLTDDDYNMTVALAPDYFEEAE